MARTFAIGDIHGAYKALKQCLERSGFNYDEDTLIQLGDVADGWSEVYEVVEELIKVRNLIHIKGNHDEWFLEYIVTGVSPNGWEQGGLGTATSYLRQIDKENLIVEKYIKNSYGLHRYYQTALNPDDVPPLHQQFFKTQHLYYVDDKNRLFIHGGFDRHKKLKGQEEYIYYWDRNLWDQAKSVKGLDKLKTEDNFTKVFIGHTHVDDWRNPEAKPQFEGNLVWNLDTGAGWSGKLTIMDVDTEEYWQSDFVTKLYPEEKGRRK